MNTAQNHQPFNPLPPVPQLETPNLEPIPSPHSSHPLTTTPSATSPYHPYIPTYGDLDNVPRDVNTLRDIIARQGSKLLLDVVAETCGETANKFRMSERDRSTLIGSLTVEFNDALRERL